MALQNDAICAFGFVVNEPKFLTHRFGHVTIAFVPEGLFAVDSFLTRFFDLIQLARGTRPGGRKLVAPLFKTNAAKHLQHFTIGHTLDTLGSTARVTFVW